MSEHKKPTDTSASEQEIGFGCRVNITSAAKIEIVFDFYPLLFASEYKYITVLVKTFFESGQIVPCEISINLKSYKTIKKAISTSLNEIECVF